MPRRTSPKPAILLNESSYLNILPKMVRTRSQSIDEGKEELTTDAEDSDDLEIVDVEVQGVSDVSFSEEENEGNSFDGSGGEEDDSENDNSENDSDGDDDESDNEEIKMHPSLTSTRDNLLRTNTTKQGGKNALTSLIPGYTAPMRLDSSSLNKYRGNMKELGKRAEKSDASTKDFSLEAIAKNAGSNMKRTKEGFLPKSYTAAYSHFKKGTKKATDESAGKGWFGMKPTAMTEDLKTDLAIIRNRTYLDPKRFYKSTDKHHSVVQVGTVIEGASEFYSSRLTKKERRANLTEELMADRATLDYAKNKFQKMSREKARQAELRKHRPKKRKKFY